MTTQTTQPTQPGTSTAEIIKQSPFMLIVRYLDNEISKVFEVRWVKDDNDLRQFKAGGVGKFQQIRRAEDLAGVPTTTLLAIFNHFRAKSKEQPLERFRDRATAEKRVFDILPDVAGRYVPVTAREANPMSTETKKKTTKAKPTQEEIEAKNKEKADAKAKKEQEKQAAAEQAKTEKGPGVIGTIKEFLDRDQGGTVNEVLDELVKRFPDRTRDGMQSTVKIQFSRLAKSTGRAIHNDVIEGRGRVYKFADKGEIPGERAKKAETTAAPAAETKKAE